MFQVKFAAPLGDNYLTEVARVLRQVADDIEWQGRPNDKVVIRASNGSAIGYWSESRR